MEKYFHERRILNGLVKIIIGHTGLILVTENYFSERLFSENFSHEKSFWVTFLSVGYGGLKTGNKKHFLKIFFHRKSYYWKIFR